MRRIRHPLDVGPNDGHHRSRITHNRRGARQQRLGVVGKAINRLLKLAYTGTHGEEQQNGRDQDAHSQNEHDDLQHTAGPLEQATVWDRAGDDGVR